jgi:nitrite reductase/ring-hydroxylating ferredoxin subunit
VDYVTVARASELTPGSVRLVRAGDRWYALANVEGTLYAVDNNCPHNGGSLGKGTLSGRELRCPVHAWSWDVTTGRACFPPNDWRLRRIPLLIEGDEVKLPVL